MACRSTFPAFARLGQIYVGRGRRGATLLPLPSVGLAIVMGVALATAPKGVVPAVYILGGAFQLVL